MIYMNLNKSKSCVLCVIIFTTVTKTVLNSVNMQTTLRKQLNLAAINYTVNSKNCLKSMR